VSGSSVATWLAALALDLVAGEPPARLHPVVAVGRLITVLERRAPRSERAELAYGVALAALPAAAAAAAAALAVRGAGRAGVPLVVWLLKTQFALRALLVASDGVARALERGDVGGARAELPALVSRPTADLDHEHIASAAIESCSENLCDSYVAPLFWYRVGGLPAAAAYRAVNTADAMIGYRGRYERLGKATARLDDALNFIPARLSALALVAAAAVLRGTGIRSLRGAWREHGRTASPNAGWPMAAAAGACGVWLEKPGHYRLGGGRAPGARDVQAARRLTLAAALLVTLPLLLSSRGRSG